MPIPPLSPYEEITRKEAEELGLNDEQMEELRLKVVDTPADPVDPKEPISTTTESIYYSGDVGDEMKAKQERIDAEMKRQFADRLSYNPNPEPPAFDVAAEQAEVDAYKEQRYESIKGDNVEEYPLLGKVIVNPDGTKNYVPSPDETGMGLVPKKAALDMARGLLSIPELWGGKSYKDIVPLATTEDEAVLIVSEITQLGVGALTGVGAVNLVTKLSKIGTYAPALLKVLQAPQKILGKGTVSSGLGTAAVATEETGTLIDDTFVDAANPFASEKGKEDAATKVTILTESLAFGLAGRLAVGAWEKLSLGSIPSALSVIFASDKKLKQQTIDEMARRVNATKELIENGATPEAIDASRDALYQLMDERMVAKTGMTVDEFVAKQSAGEIGTDTFTPIPGELIDNDLLTGMYTAARLNTNQEEAMKMLNSLLGKNEAARIKAIEKQGEQILSTYAPTGKAAAEEVRDTAATTLAAERTALQQTKEQGTQAALASRDTAIEGIEAGADARLGALRQQTDEALAASQTAVTDAERAAAQARTGARTEVDTAARNLSPDELAAQMDPRAMVKPVDDRLRSMVEQKNKLADTMKAELDTLPLDPDETKELYSSLVAEARNAAKLHEGEDAMKAAYRPLSRFIKAVKARIPEENEAAAELLDQFKEGIDDGGELFDLIEQIGKSMEVGDLPPVTAKDLLAIRTELSTAAGDLKRKAVQGGADTTMSNDLGQYLRDTASVLDSKIDDLAQRSPAAQQAKAEFDDYFKNTFAESWRTGTGREYQEELFSAMTEADRVKVANDMLNTIVNPKAKPEERVFIRNVVEGMEPEEKGLFIQSIQPRITAGFSSKDNVQRLLLSDRDPVEVAGALAKEIEVYLTGTKQYFDVLPGAETRLRELQTKLQQVAAKSSADIEASTAAVSAETARQKALSKGLDQTASDVQRSTGRQIGTVEADAREAIAELKTTFDSANKALNESALAAISTKETTPATWFKQQLSNPDAGLQNVEDLWKRAANTPVDPSTGLPRGQQAIKEAVADALWQGEGAVYPVTGKLTGREPSLKPLLLATEDAGTPANKILNSVFADDPNALEIMKRFGRAAAARQKTQNVKGVTNSKTADIKAAQSVLSGINTLIYGPLNRTGTKVRVITNWVLKHGGKGETLGTIQADVLSNPKYTKQIIDRAAEFEKEALMGPDEALGTAFFATMMGSLGYRGYDKASDPYALAEQEIRSVTLGTETEEAFSQ